MAERYIDYLRSLDPGLVGRSDRELIEAYARGRGVSLEEAAAYLDRPIEGPGLISGLKSGGAALVGGLGALAGATVGGLAAEVARRRMEAAGVPPEEIERQRQVILQDYLDNPATRFAEGVQFFNRGPASLDEVWENPLGALGYATGQAATLLGPAAAGRAAALAGRGIASAVGGTAGRAAQGVGRAVELAGASRGAQAVTFSAPSAFDIASQQLDKGDVRPLDLITGAAVSGAIERLTGPERLFFGAAGPLGKTPVRTVAKNLLRGAVEESMQEPVQTTIESIAGSQELPSGEELALSSVLGAMGGGVLGGALSIPAALRQGQQGESPSRPPIGDPAVQQALEEGETSRSSVRYGQVQPTPMPAPPEVDQALRSAEQDAVEFKGVLPRVFYPSTEQVYRPSPAAHVAALGEAAMPSTTPYGRKSVTPHPVEPLPGPAGADEAIRQAEAIEFGNILARVFNPPSDEVVTPSPGLHTAVAPAQEISPATARRFAPLARGQVQPEPLAPPDAVQQELARANAVDFAGVLANIYGPQEPYTPHPAVHMAALGQASQKTPPAQQGLSTPPAAQPSGSVREASSAKPRKIDTETPIRDFLPLYVEARKRFIEKGPTRTSTRYLKNVLNKLGLSEDSTVGELVERMAANIEDGTVDRQAKFVEEALKQAGLTGPITRAEQAVQEEARVSKRVDTLVRAAIGDPSINDDLIANAVEPRDTETLSEYVENVLMPFLTTVKVRQRKGKRGKKPEPVAGEKELESFLETIKAFEQGDEISDVAEKLGKSKSTIRAQIHNAKKKLIAALDQLPKNVGEPMKEALKRLMDEAADTTRRALPSATVGEVTEAISEGTLSVEIAKDEEQIGREEVAEGKVLRVRKRSGTSGSGLGKSAKPTSVVDEAGAGEAEQASARAARQVQVAVEKAKDLFEDQPQLREQYELKREAFELPPLDEIPDGMAKGAFYVAVAEQGEVTDDTLALLKGMIENDLLEFSDLFGRRGGSSGGPKATPERIVQVIKEMFPNYDPREHAANVRVYANLDEMRQDLGDDSPAVDHFTKRKTAVASVMPVLPSPRQTRGASTNALSSTLIILADRVPDNERFIRGLIMHELGAHLGLQRIIGPRNLKVFVKEIERWAKRGDSRSNATAILVAGEAIKRARDSINITLRGMKLEEIPRNADVSGHFSLLRNNVSGRLREATSREEKAKWSNKLRRLERLEHIYDAEVLAYTATVMAEMGVFDDTTSPLYKDTYPLVSLFKRLVEVLVRLIRRYFGLYVKPPGMSMDDLASLLYGSAYQYFDYSWLFNAASVKAWDVDRLATGAYYRIAVDMPYLYRKSTMPSEAEAMPTLLADLAVSPFVMSEEVSPQDIAKMAGIRLSSDDEEARIYQAVERRVAIDRQTIEVPGNLVLDLTRPLEEQPGEARRVIEGLAEIAETSPQSLLHAPEKALRELGFYNAFSYIRERGFAVVVGFDAEAERDIAPTASGARGVPFTYPRLPVFGWVVDLPRAVQGAVSVEMKDEPYAPDVSERRTSAYLRFNEAVVRVMEENPELSYRQAITRTEMFRRWYGRGPTMWGEPVVFYHSTTSPASFPSFRDRLFSDRWFHFGSPDAAETRFHHRREAMPHGGYTIPVYLAVQQPVVGPDLGNFRDNIALFPEKLLRVVYSSLLNGSLGIQATPHISRNISEARMDANGLLDTLNGNTDTYRPTVEAIKAYARITASWISDDSVFVDTAERNTLTVLHAFLDTFFRNPESKTAAEHVNSDTIPLYNIATSINRNESGLVEEYARIFEENSDGYLYHNTVEGGGVSVAVYSSTKIKSIHAVAFSPVADDFLFMDVLDTPKDSSVRTVLDATPEPVRKWGRAVVDAATNVVRKGVYAAAFTHDLINMVKDVLPSAARLEAIRQRQEIERRGLVGRAELIMQDFVNLAPEERDRVQKFIYDATVEQKWFVKPDWRGKEAVKDIEVDEALAKRFEKFSDAAKDVILRVFQYGDMIWHAKFSAIMADVDAQEREQIEDMKDSVREEYTKRIEDAKTDDERQKLVKEMEKEIERRESEIREEAAAQRKRLREQLPARLPGPYAPLMRYGRYVVVGMSREMADAIDAGKKGKKVTEMMADPNHYWVEFHDSFAKAKARQRELAQQFDEVDAFERARWERPIDQMPLNAYQRLLEAFTQVDDPKLRQKMRATLHDLYVASLADTASQKSKLRRQYVAGFDYRDIMATFARRAESDARFISHVLYGREAARAMQAMKREAMARKTPVTGRKASREERLRVYNELAARYAATMAHESSRLVNAGLSVSSFWMLLSSPAYYLQNLTQPVMMSMPYMVGKFSVKEVTDAFVQAYKDVTPFVKTVTKEWVADLNKIVNRSGGLYDEKGRFLGDKDKLMLERMLDKGILDIGIDTEMGTLLDTHPALQPAARIHQKLVRLARRVEIINRTSTALAAFRLASKKGMSFEDALAYTEDVLKTTHGDYSQHAAPRMFVNNIGRLVLQFRKFQLIQISMLAKLFHATFRGESPEVRATARRALLATISQALIFTGIKGLPGWALLGWLLKLLLEDEEPYDLDYETYRAMNSLFGKGFADMMINGVPSLLNMSLTSKIGWGNVFSLFPYTDIDLSSRDGLAKALLAASGPLIGGLGANVAEGLGLMRMGAYYRGLELMLPRGLRDAMRAYRIASEGLATRRGEVLIPDEEIDTLDTFLQLLGLPSHKVSKAYLRRSIMFELEQHFKRLSAELRFRYTLAWREGDTEAMRRIEDRWRELNDARARYGFKRRPVKDLRSAVRESRRRERRTLRGVPYSRGSQRAAQRIAETI